MNKINESVKKYDNNIDLEFKCNSKDNEELNKLIKEIKNLGIIEHNKKNNNNLFSFKQCPKNMNYNINYILSGPNDNIIVKSGKRKWFGIICNVTFEKQKIYKWKIKILKTANYNIMLGVSPSDFNISTSFYSTYGWYIYCLDSSLYSGPPHNYIGKETNLKVVKNEIIMIMDINNKKLKCIIDNGEENELYSNIPTDIPLTPTVFLNDVNDSLEINEC